MKQQSLGARFGLTGKVGAVLPVLPPWLALVEIALLLVAPILLQFAWPAFPDLTTYNPHPYWGPVLLLSLQYGTVSGVLSAIVAIAGMVLIGLPEPDIGENHFAYLIRVWTQPVLWIATALLLGHFRMHQIEQRDELMRRVDDLTNSSSALADHATNLRARCDQLERRIAVRAISASDQTLEHLAAIARSRPADMAHHFDALVRAALPGGVASLYARDAGGLSLVAKSGWSADAPWA